MAKDNDEIAKLLQDAVDKKRWTISRAARETKVDRSFLSRLLSGKEPPRKKEDSRNVIEPDDRYRRLAVTLALEESVFLTAVANAQSRHIVRRQKNTFPQPQRPKKLQYAASDVELPDGFALTYANLLDLVHSHQPLRDEPALRDLRNEALIRLFTRDTAHDWIEALRDCKRRRSHGLSHTEHDHLGNHFDSAHHDPYYESSLTCRLIAEELTDGIAQTTRHESRDALIHLASMFYELGHCLTKRT